MNDPLDSIPFTCYIAGIPHRKPARLPDLGEALQLIPEPNNPYDPGAVKVMHGTVHLGYIPKQYTQQTRDQNLKELYVVKIDPATKWKEVKLSNIQTPETIETQNLHAELGSPSNL